MRIRLLPATFLPLAALLVFGAGCAQTISREQLAAKVQKAGGQAYSDQFLYVGDAEGYHYVHRRSVYSFGASLPVWAVGDADYKISTSDWEVAHAFPLTDNPRQWRNVMWMDGDTRGIPQSPFMYATPSFPEGAPATRPTSFPAGQNVPDTLPTTDSALPPPDSQPAAPTTQPAAPDTAPATAPAQTPAATAP
ncbi:MAG TPA: hypothetical protein VG269_05545 [Tepidisphaeraceae bacterium]|jgi:hypothetical protein|nr:hypothetical protein [Tepidisphaeraceae bacterium]